MGILWVHMGAIGCIVLRQQMALFLYEDKQMYAIVVHVWLKSQPYIKPASQQF